MAVARVVLVTAKRGGSAGFLSSAGFGFSTAGNRHDTASFSVRWKVSAAASVSSWRVTSTRVAWGEVTTAFGSARRNCIEVRADSGTSNATSTTPSFCAVRTENAASIV